MVVISACAYAYWKYQKRCKSKGRLDEVAESDHSGSGGEGFRSYSTSTSLASTQSRATYDSLTFSSHSQIRSVDTTKL